MIDITQHLHISFSITEQKRNGYYFSCSRVWLDTLQYLSQNNMLWKKDENFKNIILLLPTQYKYPWGNISEEIVILFPVCMCYNSRLCFHPKYKNNILIYAMSITVCVVTKRFKVFPGILFTLLSCHPLILFTISWIANKKTINY